MQRRKPSTVDANKRYIIHTTPQETQYNRSMNNAMKVYIVYSGGCTSDPVMECICSTEEIAKAAKEELVQKRAKLYALRGIKDPEDKARELFFWEETAVRTK